MKKVIVHIGCGKTGSSFLQTKFARDVTRFKKIGLIYPDHPSKEDALGGKVTSGNGVLLLDSRFQFEDYKNSLLFSNELLVSLLLKNNQLSSLLQKIKKVGYKPLFVMYVRNLIEHIYSTWGQTVKREGGMLSFEQFIKSNRYHYLEHITQWMELSKKLNFELKVFNYSNYKDDLYTHFITNILSVSFDGSIEEKENDDNNPPLVVNRSMTRSEYELLRLCNQHLSQDTTKLLSDNLVNELPNVLANNVVIDKKLYEYIHDKFSRQIKVVNTFLDKKEKIKIEPYSLVKGDGSEEKNSFNFSAEQLAIIVMFLNHNDKGALGLDKNEIDSIRDIAVRIEKNEIRYVEDSFFLMHLAHRFRPDGRFITERLKHYQKLLFQKKRKH